MIRYSLRCQNDHDFEGWFRSSEAYDAQRADGLVTCSICGSPDVGKTLMAPSIRAQKPPERATPDASLPAQTAPLSRPGSEIEKAISKLRAHIEGSSDYVGKDFATQARSMHEGSTPMRSIYGEANAHEARKLIDEGVAVMPLPFMPRQKTN